jgi:hypothetical protein
LQYLKSLTHTAGNCPTTTKVFLMHQQQKLPWAVPLSLTFWILGCMALLLVTQSVHSQPESSEAILIQNIQIIDIEADRIHPSSNVLIREGRIQPSENNTGDNSLVIDGEGLYLMPALWDMHAHIRHPLAESLILPQFIANGVTGIREMNSECDSPDGGDFCLSRMQQWQEQIESGELLGPRFLALSSFPVNPPWDYQASEEEIRGLVAEMDRRGVDLIKTYFRLSPQAFLWLADEAGKRGLDFAGHLPMQMRAEEAADAGLRSLEHARDFLFDCYAGSAEFRAQARTQNPEPAVRRQMVDGFIPEICQRSFAAFVENGSWYVPTHVTRRLDALASDPTFRNDPRLRYIWPEIRQQWQRDADNMAALAENPGDAEAMLAFYEKGLEITGLAHEAGVRILLGTDSGDSYSFFGSSVHDELAELVKAGLSPAEALAAATISAAEFLRLEEDYGTVEPGKVADLLLLQENPLQDINHSRSIEGLLFNGNYYDRQALDQLLEEVADSIDGMD